MPTLKQLIAEKTKRLETVPAKFSKSVQGLQASISRDIVRLVGQLEEKGGKFVLSKKNLLLAEEINDKLADILSESEYTQYVKQFASEFNAQAKVNTKYFQKAFGDFEKELAELTVKQSRNNAVALLTGEGVESSFLNPIKDIIRNAVNTGSSFSEIVKGIEDFVEGTEGSDGKLLAYSKQIAVDTFAVSDRTYTNAVAEENDFEWFYYSGGILEPVYSKSGRQIGGTRCFCYERNEKYFHYKEVESWGAGNVTDGVEGKDCGFPWSGMNANTNESTIFTYAGGYMCSHSLQPVSVFIVPKDVIQRNIDKGYFEPTEAVAEELGL